MSKRSSPIAGAVMALLAIFASLGGAAAQERLAQITTPTQEFGFEVGADYHLADYTQLVAYWQKLARESDRMTLDTLGLTEEGRPQVMAIITSPENHRDLAHYQDIATRLARADGVTEQQAHELAEEGKAVVWIDGGLHSTEVLGAQQLLQLVYDMVSNTDPETMRFLNDLIVLVAVANPDGMELVSDWYNRVDDPMERSTGNIPVLYEKYAGHDDNRDFFMVNLAETQNVAKVLFTEWYPEIVYDHHQTGPAGTVMFSPPFRDPPNYNLHPMILTTLEQIGGAMHSRFALEGKGGVTDRSGSSYSTWWNGGMRTTPYFHNEVGLLTETIGNPTPVTVPFLPEKQLEQNDLPLPVTPGEWKFKWSIEYSQTANHAVLDYASRNREHLLFGIWSMGHDAIERGSHDSWDNTPDEIYAAQAELGRSGTKADFDRLLRKPEDREPRGYIVPSDQVDFNTTIRFINALLMNGVDVLRATSSFSVQGKTYPAGSFVLKTNQAFAPQVLDMFEPQVHPNDFAYPGGPPVPPYDLTGWTLAYQMKVKFDRILDPFDGPFEKVSAWNVEPQPGRILGQAQGGFLLDHRVNDAFKVVNRVLSEGGQVWWLESPVTAGGQSYPSGAFYVQTDRARMERLARELGVDARAVAQRPQGDAMQLQHVRVGLVDQYGGSSPSGWTRFVLEDFGFDFSLVFPPELDRGDLNAKYDVLVFPDGMIRAPGGRSFNRDIDPSTIPEEYRDRLGSITAETTVPKVLEFIRNGGTAVTVGGSTSLAFYTDLAVSDYLVGDDGKRYSSEQFYIPGSLLEVGLDHASPALDGMGDSVVVMYDTSPVLKVEPGAAGVTVLGRYGGKALRSGWAWGQEKLDGGVALAEAQLGQGKLFLFTPEVTFRGQPHGTFPLMFNAIYYGPASRQRLIGDER